MPDSRLHDTSMFLPETSRQPTSDTRYRIMRKGSRYNILGPQGRIFSKYQSASIAGPRWEELTHTPWPYASSAYERGHRLWEMGLIARDQVGQRNILVQPPADPASGPQPDPQPARKQNRGRAGRKTQSAPPVKLVVITMPFSQLALPAPKIDLEQHNRLMTALHQNPTLLFTPQIKQVLQHEVEYHRPQAKWAAHLLKLLGRYERQQRTRRSIKTDSEITAKHIEWQAERLRTAVAV